MATFREVVRRTKANVQSAKTMNTAPSVVCLMNLSGYCVGEILACQYRNFHFEFQRPDFQRPPHSPGNQLLNLLWPLFFGTGLVIILHTSGKEYLRVDG